MPNVVDRASPVDREDELDIPRLHGALFAALGWSTARYRPGDSDNEAWGRLTARVATAYRLAARAKDPTDER